MNFVNMEDPDEEAEFQRELQFTKGKRGQQFARERRLNRVAGAWAAAIVLIGPAAGTAAPALREQEPQPPPPQGGGSAPGYAGGAAAPATPAAAGQDPKRLRQDEDPADHPEPKRQRQQTVKEAFHNMRGRAGRHRQWKLL